MINQKLLQQIMQLGLEEEEAKIYLYLSKVGTNKKENTAFAVGRSLSIPRSSVYLYLERLIERELLSMYKINNVRHYLAENLNRLERSIERQKEVLANVVLDIKKLAENSKDEFATRTYRGADSLVKVYDDIFDKQEMTKYSEIFVLTNTLLDKFLPKGLPTKFDKLKKLNNITTKMILVASEKDTLPSYFKTDSHREVRYMATNSIFNGSLYLYGDKIAMFSLDEGDPISIIIESKTLSQMLKSFFLCSWDLINH